MNENVFVRINISNLPEDISVNQLCILFFKKIDEKNYHSSKIELDNLQFKKYIKIKDYNTYEFDFREKAISLLSKDIIFLEKDSTITKTNNENDIQNWISDYRRLFKKTGASGKMGDLKTTMKKMEWFYREYPEFAKKDLIMKATQKYIEQESHNDFKFLQRSDYFISKEDTSKIKMSRLASFCEELTDDDLEEESDYGSFNTMI